MARRTILMDNDPTLLKTSRPVLNFDERLHKLIDDMTETMRHVGGAGIAAVQVGVLRRVVLVEVEEDELYELVNPVVTEEIGCQDGSEGCLSTPGAYGMVKRPMKITVKAQDRFGSDITVHGDDLLARAMCHEIDHLDGKLFSKLVSRWLDKEEVERERKRQDKGRRRKRR